MNTPGHEPLTPEERAWAQRLEREGPHGEPGPALDARILAAARAAVEEPAPSSARPRWPVVVGVAASVALAIGLAWRLRPLPEPVVHDESAAGAAAPASAAADASAQAARAPAAPVDGDEAIEAGPDFVPLPPPALVAPPEPQRSRQELRAQPVPPAEEPVPVAIEPPVVPSAAPPAAPPAPAPAAQSAPAAVGEVQGTRAAKAGGAAAREDTAAARRAAAEAAVAADAAGNAAEADEDIPPATADSPAVREAWLQRIRELRDAGRIDEARASLQEFIHRHPQHPVPDDLRPLAE